MMTPQRLGTTFLLTVGLGCAAALAGTFNFDFNSDPVTILDFCGTAWDGSATSNTGSASWVTSGGAGPVGNTATGPVASVPNDGFLRLTFASPDCTGALSSYLCGGVLFNDFDVGMVVAGFTFECDLRLGNGSGRPADGFSLSYVRAGDPVLLALAAGDTLPNMNGRISGSGGQFADNGSAGDLSLIEEGTQTGLSIGFDLWASGGYTIPPAPPAVGKVAPGLTQDDIGLDVRVDGTLLATIPMPNLQPVSGDDPTSLATGPYDGTGCDTNLAWVHFKADLDTAGVLNVWYKNTRLLTNFATRYYPSPGRLLLAARVGAATANIEVDNIQITTLPASEVVIGPVSGTATGFSLSVADSGAAVADPTTVQVWLNGTPITPAASKTGGTTTIRYDDPAHPLPPGTTNTVTVSLTQTNGQQIGPVDRTYVVTELPPGPGQVKWFYATGGPVDSSPALGADGTVYVGSLDQNVYALDGSTGAREWTFATGGWVTSSPAIGSDGTVYVGSHDHNVYALDGATGARKWAFATGDAVYWASPALGADGTVYVGSEDHRLYALEGATGRLKWAFVSAAAVYSSPAIGADGTIYFVTYPRVYALDGATGAIKWTFDPGGAGSSSPALGADGTVYFGSSDGTVYALDGATGVRRWAVAGSVYSSPAVGGDGAVYVGLNDGKVLALDEATGAPRWAFVTGNSIASSPALAADGTVYVGSLDYKVYALDGASGIPRWALATGHEVTSSATIGGDGTVYVGSNDGKLYALRGSAGLANGPWPKFRQNPQNTGRVGAGEPGQTPTVVAEPEDAMAVVGTSVSFAVTANGTAPLAYSWRKDDSLLVEGGRITGVNTARLSLTDVLASDAGRYQVVVTNSFGFVTSRSAVLAVSGRAPGQKLWAFEAAGPVRSSPAIGVDGTVYVAADNPARSVYALNAATGQMLWEFQTSCCNDVRASPAVGSDGTVYVGSDDSRLFALDGATGNIRWEYQAGSDSVFSSPAVGSDGTVYVGSSDRKIYALNGATG